MSPHDDQAELALLLQGPDDFRYFEGYLPLDTHSKQIRLLRMRLEANDEIHGEIVYTNLTKPIEYKALSYCWGPPAVPKTIHIDSEVITVRSSVHDFLLTLCHRGQSIPVWIDCICINQRDVNERNQQVSMMGDIYRNAVSVESWLGLPDPHTNYTFAYMKFQSHNKVLSSGKSADIEDLAREGLQVILDRPYWRRLWPIQEMMLARSLYITCGDKSVAWDDLISAVDALLSSTQHIIAALKTLRIQNQVSVYPEVALLRLRDRLATLAFASKSSGKVEHDTAGIQVRSSAFSVKSWRPDLRIIAGRMRDEAEVIQKVFIEISLLGQMSRFAHQACEDPRDRIFGLLSVVGTVPKIKVDYSKTWALLLIDLIEAANDTFRLLIDHELTSDSCSSGYTVGEKSIASIDLNHFCAYLEAAVKCLEIIIRSTERADFLSTLCDVPNTSSFCHKLLPYRLMLRNERLRNFSGIGLNEYKENMLLNFEYEFLRGSFPYCEIHWDNADCVPNIEISATDSMDYLCVLAGTTQLYHALMEFGEIQSCSQAVLVEWNLHPQNVVCTFSLHYSRFAILMLISYGISKSFGDELGGYLRARREKFARPVLCDCEVDPELNAESFVAWEKCVQEHRNTLSSVINSYDSSSERETEDDYEIPHTSPWLRIE